MTDTQRHQRNTTMLSECDRVFAARLRAVLDQLEADGFRPRIQQAWRSPAEQVLKVEQGYSAVRWGFHNATGGDGTPEALAADVLDDTDVGDDGQPNVSNGLAFVFALSRACAAHHLMTGIWFGLPNPVAAGLRRAIAGRDLTWPRKNIGWDPYHVQPAGLTITAARKGARPA